MTKWNQFVENRLATSGLLEPKTKIAKLRSILPQIEAALSNGSSYEDCIEFLKSVGLDYTLSYFRKSLSLARKAGPLQTQTGAKAEVQEATAGKIKIPSKENPDDHEIRKKLNSHDVLVVRRENGVVISHIETSDNLINKIPNLDDFM